MIWHCYNTTLAYLSLLCPKIVERLFGSWMRRFGLCSSRHVASSPWRGLWGQSVDRYGMPRVTTPEAHLPPPRRERNCALSNPGYSIASQTSILLYSAWKELGTSFSSYTAGTCPTTILPAPEPTKNANQKSPRAFTSHSSEQHWNWNSESRAEVVTAAIESREYFFFTVVYYCGC